MRTEHLSCLEFAKAQLSALDDQFLDFSQSIIAQLQMKSNVAHTASERDLTLFKRASKRSGLF
jgi:hypothetical protein